MPAAAGTATALETPGTTVTCRAAGHHFLAAAPEDERVAALESHDARSLQCMLDEQPFDVGLGNRVMPRSLPDVDEKGVRGEFTQATVRCEPVVEHDIG
jgi:hypothetical protein